MLSSRGTIVLVSLCTCFMHSALCATYTVNVGSTQTGKSNLFSPSTLTIMQGDVVNFVWQSQNHDVVSGTSCQPNGIFDSGGPYNPPHSWSYTFNTAGIFPFFCTPHCAAGMTVRHSAICSLPHLRRHNVVYRPYRALEASGRPHRRSGDHNCKRSNLFNNSRCQHLHSCCCCSDHVRRECHPCHVDLRCRHHNHHSSGLHGGHVDDSCGDDHSVRKHLSRYGTSLLQLACALCEQLYGCASVCAMLVYGIHCLT